MKLWERILEARLRTEVSICEQQNDLMPKKSTTDAIFAVRVLLVAVSTEKVRGSCIMCLSTLRKHMTGCQERS